MKKRWAIILFVIVIVAIIVMRFGLLAWNNHPLYIDEIASAVHADSLIKTGKDFAGQTWPMMSKSFGGGYTTSVYLYPLTAWVWLFGDSAFALRAFSQFVGILAVFVISYGVYLWRGKRTGVIALLVGLTLPWSWMNSNMAWDPATAPLFVASGFVFFSLLANRKNPSRKILLYSSLMTLSFVLAAYSYPPLRVGAPIMLAGALFWLYRKKYVTRNATLLSLVTGLILSLPLLQFLLSPDAMERSDQLSVFGHSWLNGLGLFFYHTIALFSPIKLFLTGDVNLQHSSGFEGMLSIAGAVGIGYLVYHLCKFRRSDKLKVLSIIAIFGAIAGFVGSALTIDMQHYLRAVGAMPFFIILISLGLEKIIVISSKNIRYILIAITAVSILLFIVDLAIWYPVRSADYFGASARNSYEQSAIDYYYNSR